MHNVQPSNPFIPPISFDETDEKHDNFKATLTTGDNGFFSIRILVGTMPGLVWTNITVNRMI